MKVIIAGSRNLCKYEYIEEAIKKSNFKINTIISGGAKGIDKLGEKYALNNNIELIIYPADWNKYGKSAGYIRNTEMLKECNALIAIWDGKSKGTKHMIEIVKKSNKDFFVLKK
jgi:hypothetical protein